MTMTAFCECTLKNSHRKHFSQPQMHEISFAGRTLPRPTGRAYSAAQTFYLDLKEPTSKERKKGRRGEEGVAREGEICVIGLKGMDAPETKCCVPNDTEGSCITAVS